MIPLLPFACLSPPFYHTPPPNASALRKNRLSGTAGEPVSVVFSEFVLVEDTQDLVKGLVHLVLGLLALHLVQRLLTCDVACGGVCSPGVWAQLVKSMAYVKQHRPTAVEFCGKLAGDRERRFRVQFEGGGRYDAPMGKCELGRGIARRLFMRPACHHCTYATTDRPSDVTLGDFSGGSFAPEEKKSGVSMLLINTVKGAQVFDMLPLEKQHRTLEEAAACCAALREPPAAPSEREQFFRAMEQLPFQQVRARFLSVMQHQNGGVADRLRGLLRREKKEKKA